MKPFEVEVKREVRSAEISVTFAEVFDVAPALPRPLKSKFHLEFITAEGLVRESELIAPLDVDAEGEGEPLVADTDTRQARQLASNTLYMRKAKEYALVHEELADWYDSFLSKVRILQMIVSGVISMILALKVPDADNPVAIVTVFIGIVKSWVDIADYENLCSKHRTAAGGFEELHEDTQAFIAGLEENAADIAKTPASAAAPPPDQPTHGSSADVEKSRKKRALQHEASHGAQLMSAMSSVPEATAAAAAAAPAAAATAVAAVDAMFAPADDLSDPQQPGSTLLRLRRLYRETVEYRVVHALLESKMLRMKHALSFLNVILSSLLSGLLFLSHLVPHSEQISTGMSFAMTTLNTVVLKLDIATRASEHGKGRLAYASFQRQLATALLLEPPEELFERMDEYAAKFKELKCGSPRIKPVFLHGLRDKDGLMFPLITPPFAAPRSCFQSIVAMFPCTKKIQPEKIPPSKE